MFSSTKRRKDHLKTSQIVDFIPPQRHDGEHSYIWFSQIDPLTGKLKRKKYMLDRFRKGKERDTAAQRISMNIYSQVLHGWNVWVDGDNMRSQHPVWEVLTIYQDYISALYRKGSMKQHTHRDYHSRLRILKEYIQKECPNVKVCAQLDQAFFTDYLDYLITERDVSARTRNNFRTWCSTFCSWMVEKKYIKENPIQYIHQLKESEKMRDAIPAAALARMREYLYNKDKHFLLACLMEYYTFIRPNELRQLKIKNFSIQDKEVTVPAEVAKNGTERRVGLNTKILHLMAELRIFDAPSHYYLFGDNMQPSEHICYYNRFRYEWNKMRKELRWPDSFQFYSLKDSGIRDLGNAEGVVVARDQAGHSDVAVTNKYLKRGRVIPDEVKNFDGVL